MKLRLILSPQAELSSTSSTFSALTALPRRLLATELVPRSCSKPKLDGVGRLGDSWGEGPRPSMGESGCFTDASVPRRSLCGIPSSVPYVINDARDSAPPACEDTIGCCGAQDGDNVLAACLDTSAASSTKTSGPNCGTVVMKPDFFLSLIFLNLLDQYLQLISTQRILPHPSRLTWYRRSLRRLAGGPPLRLFANVLGDEGIPPACSQVSTSSQHSPFNLPQAFVVTDDIVVRQDHKNRGEGDAPIDIRGDHDLFVEHVVSSP